MSCIGRLPRLRMSIVQLRTRAALCLMPCTLHKAVISRGYGLFETDYGEGDSDEGRRRTGMEGDGKLDGRTL